MDRRTLVVIFELRKIRKEKLETRVIFNGCFFKRLFKRVHCLGKSFNYVLRTDT